MSNNNRITIPIIPYGLRHEETIVQIASALDSIDCLVTDVFQQIEKNIAKHREYLSSLQKRSENIAAKVEQLAGKNVATTVYSDPKFPSVKSSSEPLFNISLQPIEKKSNVFIESKFQHAKYSKSLSKLHFFHVKSEPRSDEEELILEKGLGPIPSDVDCVNSLLLFNTSENLYQKYVFLDPLAVDTDTKSLSEDKKKDDIAAAPTSILTDQVFENRDYDGSFYSPPFVEVPSFNLPLDLPDLPGIAGESRYNFTSESLIAPSKQPQESEKIKNIEDISATDLPVIAKKTKTQSSTAENAENTPAPSSSTESSHQTTVPPPPAPPPPPPPPPPSFPLEAPIPPPFPEADGTSKSSETASTVPKQDVPKKPPPAENMHATLMEAIRNAGGKERAKLRPVEERNEDSAKVTKSNSNDQFLDQLYNVLALRRKGISGQGKAIDKSGGIMNRVSELIEPSSDSEDDSGESDGDNDWEE